MYKNKQPEIMKSSTILQSIFALMLVCLFALKTNAQSNKNISVSGFDEVSVSSGIDLYITHGSSESAKVTAHEDVIDNVVLQKSGNTLSIRFRENFSLSRLLSNQGVKVYLTVKTLHSISASGGSDVYSQNTIKTDRLKARASGGADLKLSLNTTDLEVESSGGADVELKGSATNMTVRASGGSDIEAYGLVAQYAKASASGGADININVAKALEAGASGGGDIHFKGAAALKNTSSSKSGSVKRLN